MNEQINYILQQLAVKFNTTVQHLWEVLTHQAVVQGGCGLILNILWIIALILVWKYLSRTISPRAKYDTFEYWMGDDGWVWILFWLGTIVLMIATSYNVCEYVPMLINPEYWALKQIILK
jgi:hypothetical protein